MLTIIETQPQNGEGGGDIELGEGMTKSLLDPIQVTLVERDLTQMAGVIIRQEVITSEVMAQALGVPYEAKNKCEFHITKLSTPTTPTTLTHANDHR